MEIPPMMAATMQSTILAAISNLLAQKLSAYRANTPLVVDWVTVFQFVLYAVVSTPPNFLWQDFLERSFPAKKMVATRPASGKKDEKTDTDTAMVPKLDLGNTVKKLVLDQTVGSAVNTFMFSVFIHSVRMAMQHRPAEAEHSLMFLVQSFGGQIEGGKPALDFTVVRTDEVMAQARAEFFPLMMAGWRLWPFVSLVNFAFVPTVEGRNLVGGLAGIVWGVYVSLFTATS